MTASLRRSALHDSAVEGSPHQAELHGMLASVELPGDGATPPIMLTDASCLPRIGVKGPQAEAWLSAHGLSVPAGANTWTRAGDEVLVARLGRTEFFLEDRLGGAAVERCRSALAPAPGLYPVPRQDAALALAGARLNDLLVQTCNIDFKSAALRERTLVMSSMAGVPVLALWDQNQAGPLMRIWCDGTFGQYLWETLLAIAREEGGGPVGLRKLFPDVPGISMVR